MISIREIKGDELKAGYEKVFKEAFPPQELKPLSAIEEMTAQGIYRTMALFDEGQPVGYICLWLDMPYVLIDYLCVDKNCRNGGYGGHLIEKTVAAFPEDTVFIGEVEAPTGIAERDVMIKRRLGFYKRLGARVIGYDSALFGVHYNTIVWAKGDIDEAETMRRHASFYRERFSQKLYDAAVQIPFMPGYELKTFDHWEE